MADILKSIDQALDFKPPGDAPTDTIEGLIGPEPPEETIESLIGQPPKPVDTVPGNEWGMTMDPFLSQGPVGRMADAIGEGVKSGWGAGDLGWSDAVTEGLKKAGIFTDAQKGQQGVVRSINEAFFRPMLGPLATALEFGYRTSAAGFGGVQAGVAQGFAEAGQPQLGRDIAGAPEAFAQEFFGLRGVLPEGAILPPRLTPEAAHIIGQSEGQFHGTVIDVRPDPSDMPVKEAQGQAAAAEAVHPAIPVPGEPETPPAPEAAPEPPDIHAAARQIAPDTFGEYDALSEQQATLRAQITDQQTALRTAAEAQAPGAAEIATFSAGWKTRRPGSPRSIRRGWTSCCRRTMRSWRTSSPCRP